MPGLPADANSYLIKIQDELKLPVRANLLLKRMLQNCEGMMQNFLNKHGPEIIAAALVLVVAEELEDACEDMEETWPAEVGYVDILDIYEVCPEEISCLSIQTTRCAEFYVILRHFAYDIYGIDIVNYKMS